MWWCRLALPFLLTATASLAACGFQPLYGDQGAVGPSTAEALASIRVEAIADRSGQQLHNLLLNDLSPYGRPADPRYILTVDVTATKEELGFRRDETPTRANLNLRANYTLRQASDGTVLLTSMSRSTSSYDILENPFAALVSEEDALERATQALSEDIRTRLAVFLSDAVAKAP
ncbi:LPS assembly lipoprotein LptE [Rhodospirillaceae bacterium SYSU D60014]|uniref:LPS assembly lipoprotein LptE n=1 Tax=Virgifigura deserti TaxID=2268457 RepID=UPI000E66AA15